MFHPKAGAQYRKSSDNSKSDSNPSNVVYERTERVMYDYENPSSSRFGTAKANKVVAEAPYERGNHHHTHHQYHRYNHNVANVKTEKPYHSIHPSPTNQLPDFQTEFGLFGKTVRRSLDEECDDAYFTGHDISDLYDRPNDQKLQYPYTKCYITPDAQQQYREVVDKHAFEHTKHVHSTLNSVEGQRKSIDGKSNNERSSKNQTGKQNADEGHAILHKYSSKGHEDKHFKNDCKEKDPDFIVHNKPYVSAEGKVCDNNICVTQHPKDPKNVPVGLQNVADECKILTKTKHVFPFKETQSGHLLIDPKHVAFENHKLSVLVANPNKTKLNININNNETGEIHAITDPGREKKTQKSNDSSPPSHSPTLDQDPEEVRNFLLKINQGSAKKDLPPTDDPAGRRLVESLSLDNQYSTASRGTESYMENLHDRIKKAINPDTYILIGQKSFPCHAVALGVCSPFFENIQRPRQNIHKIELPEKMVSPQIFPSIMEWMLQTEEGRKSIVAKDNVIPIYTAAVYLDMQELQNQCLDFVHSSINPGDPLLMLMWDEVKAKPRCQEMMVALASKAASLFPDLYKSKKFLRLEVDELTMLLSSDEVIINNELQIFDAAIRWLLFDWFNRKVYIPTVMGSVRFGLMSPLNLTQINHCPDTFRERNSKEYSQILSHPEVKALREVGLAYSILLESYENRPEELKKWLETSKISRPRPRVNVVNTKAKLSPSQTITTLKAKEERAETAMSEDKVKLSSREASRKRLENPLKREKEETGLPVDNLSQPQGESQSEWEKVQSHVIYKPSDSQVPITTTAAPNFSLKDRMAGSFITPENDSNDPLPKGNTQAISQPTKKEKQMNRETRKSNPKLPSAATNEVSHSNPSDPVTLIYPTQSQPISQTNPNPTIPNQTGKMTPSPNNPVQSDPPMAPYPNPSQSNGVDPNPNKATTSQNPNKSARSPPNPQSTDPTVTKNEPEKQTPLARKSISSNKSKLMQPKYFSNSKSPGDKKPSPGSKNSEDSETDT